MLDRIIEKSPAKLNLFLKIISKRKDGFHNIRSGVTLLNIHDEIIAEKNSKFSIKYIGDFAPINNNYDNCIIEKLFKFIKIKKPKYRFIIKKNLPVMSGLGSASSNAAATLRILEKLDLIKIKDIYKFTKIGSDIPIFIYLNDCLVRGKGDKITNQIFPKYYFVLVKPVSNCSTELMYKKLNIKNLIKNNEYDSDTINEYDSGNDFEKIIIKENNEIKYILKFLQNLDKTIFSGITGSGSCCFAAFDSYEMANNSLNLFKQSYPNLWSLVAENNC